MILMIPFSSYQTSVLEFGHPFPSDVDHEFIPFGYIAFNTSRECFPVRTVEISCPYLEYNSDKLYFQMQAFGASARIFLASIIVPVSFRPSLPYLRLGLQRKPYWESLISFLSDWPCIHFLSHNFALHHYPPTYIATDWDSQ